MLGDIYRKSTALSKPLFHFLFGPQADRQEPQVPLKTLFFLPKTIQCLEVLRYAFPTRTVARQLWMTYNIYGNCIEFKQTFKSVEFHQNISEFMNTLLGTTTLQQVARNSPRSGQNTPNNKKLHVT